MTYQQTLDYMFASLPMYQRIGSEAFKKDLTNTLALCEALGNPQHKIRCVHVAGTNGKGSTTHFIAAILAAQGLKVGIYTSPHYLDFRERIKIGSEYISEAAVIEFIARAKPVLEAIKPSFFEMTVAMAFDYFANQNVDIAVIEVGLGGRLDSTNIITPLLSVITNISLDHQAMLGDTLPEIAGEKAGIIKPKVPVVIAETQLELEAVFRNKAAAENAPIFFADKTYTISAFSTDYETNTMQVSILDSETKKETYRLDALGDYQLKNVVGALKTIAILNLYHSFEISTETIKKGLAAVRKLTKMQGRWQVLATKPFTIADSGHNEGGLRQTMTQLAAFCQTKRETAQTSRLHFVLGVVNDKALDTILALLPKNAVYYFAKADIPRGLEAHLLQSEAARFGLNGTTHSSTQEAYQIAQKKATDDDIIFIGGSCFTVAEVI